MKLTMKMNKLASILVLALALVFIIYMNFHITVNALDEVTVRLDRSTDSCR